MQDASEHIPLVHLRWEHRSKQRYYEAHLGTDLMEDIVLTKVWGGIGKRNGRIIHVAYAAPAQALQALQKIIHLREKRGYTLVSEVKV